MVFVYAKYSLFPTNKRLDDLDELALQAQELGGV